VCLGFIFNSFIIIYIYIYCFIYNFIYFDSHDQESPDGLAEATRMRELAAGMRATSGYDFASVERWGGGLTGPRLSCPGPRQQAALGD